MYSIILNHYFGDGNDDTPDDYPIDPEHCSIEEWSAFFGWPPIETTTPDLTEADLPF